MIKIVTMCRQGLVRSVALADVLKLHFEPCDVIPIGHFGNTKETRDMLMDWADKIVVMEAHYMQYIDETYMHKALVCDVGPDRYGSSKHPQLIDQVWRWCRINQNILGVVEHTKKL